MPENTDRQFSTFRKEALSQLQVPDELDLLFTPVTSKNTFAWLTLSALGLGFILWLILGSIPISVEGVGVLLQGEDDQEWTVYAYIPVELAKQIKVGKTVEVEPTTVNSAEYGEMIGKIIEMTPYAVSDEFILKSLRNGALVKYVNQKGEALIQVKIEPLLDSRAPSGFKWSAGVGPNRHLTTETICTVKGIVGYIAPIYYIIPFSMFSLIM